VELKRSYSSAVRLEAARSPYAEGALKEGGRREKEHRELASVSECTLYLISVCVSDMFVLQFSAKTVGPITMHLQSAVLDPSM
jgi:hypothetical protein